jgi:Winged helix DNA-binding domain
MSDRGPTPQPRRLRTTLTDRALNRALLKRQLLLRRRRIGVADAIEHLVALQAQVPRDPYVALWSRVDRFRPEELSDLIADRRAVRMGLLRATLHLVTDRDALRLRPVIDPAIRRAYRTGSPFPRRLEGLDESEVVAFAAKLFEERPRTRSELGPLLAERWPERDASALAYAASYLLPLVQVTPRGLWRRPGPSAFTTVGSWLGTTPDGDGEPDEVIMRYLAAFGPSTVADAQAWSGLPGLRPALERLRPRLRTFRDERGRELFDVPKAPLPDPDVPAAPRFLPEYDNAFLAHADRARIVSESHRKRMFVVGWGQLLVDGFIAARWRADPNREGALVVQPYRRLSGLERSEIADEAVRLLAFLDGVEAGDDVRFLPE